MRSYISGTGALHFVSVWDSLCFKTNTYTHSHTFTHSTHMHTYTYTHPHTHNNTLIHTFTHTHIHSYTHTHTYTLTNKHIPSHAHTHHITHTHKHRKEANIFEKAKALEFCARIKTIDQRTSTCKIHILEEGDEIKQFWELLGGKTDIATAEQGGVCVCVCVMCVCVCVCVM